MVWNEFKVQNKEKCAIDRYTHSHLLKYNLFYQYENDFNQYRTGVSIRTCLTLIKTYKLIIWKHHKYQKLKSQIAV